MKTILKNIVTAFLALFVGYVFYLNCTLYYQPEFALRNNSTINIQLLHQLKFLEKQMHNGGADEMQHSYPEGFVFMHALYGLSWIELAQALSPGDTLRQHALNEIKYSISEISSSKGTSVFYKDLPLPYGAFYNGWRNYLIGKYLSIQKESERDTEIIADYQSTCKTIAATLHQYATPFLESYPEMVWPADIMPCVASLSLHDKIFKPEYSNTIHLWLEKLEKHTDALGLIPHSCKPLTGEVREPARGSSQSLILNFLIEIDSAYANKQFAIYKEHFLDHRFGLVGIREYPKEKTGEGDIDSGPVILGIGGAASIVGQRTMSRYGESTAYTSLRNSIEAFGMGDDEDDGKKYLFGALPIADAFIAWSNSSEASVPIAESTGWRSKFHLISLATCAGLLLVISRIWKKYFYRRKEISQAH